MKGKGEWGAVTRSLDNICHERLLMYVDNMALKLSVHHFANLVVRPGRPHNKVRVILCAIRRLLTSVNARLRHAAPHSSSIQQ